MPRKSAASADKGRGSCCSLDAVKQFLQRDIIPEGYSKNDKRALRRRARSFVLVDGELYFTGGRSRHNRGLLEGEKNDSENPENELDHTQVLRRVLFSPEEQQDAVDRAHIGEDGSHHGMEKTTEMVSNNYYWMGIIYSVRNTIHSCLHCGPRSKTPSNAIGFKLGQQPTPAHTSTPTSIMLTSGDPATGSAVAMLNEDDGECEDTADAGDWNDGAFEAESAEVVTQCQTAPALIKHEVPDVFFVTKDICSHFWQKVEIQMFGPFQAGSKQVYVTVALDSYSQFPEATIMEVLSTATLTNFILNLFCRYGMMEKLSLLQNKLTKNKEILINTQDMQQAGIVPTLLFPHVNPLDERWRHIEQSLGNFVGLYPDFWYYCLEAFMVPLRITLPPEAEYTPYFLVHGREPPIPEKLSTIYMECSMTTSEIQLTDEQEKQIVAMVTTTYGILSDHPSIPAYVPEPPATAEVNGTSKGVSVEERTENIAIKAAKKKRGRPPSKSKFVVEKRDENQELTHKTVKEEGEKASSAQHYDSDAAAFDHADDSDEDETYEPASKAMDMNRQQQQPQQQQTVRMSTRRRTATYKAQEAGLLVEKSYTVLQSRESSILPAKEKASDAREKKPKRKKVDKTDSLINVSVGSTPGSTLLKRKRGRPCKNTNGSDKVETQIKVKKKMAAEGANSKTATNLQKNSLDAFYFILKQYLEQGLFPPGTSDHTKQSIVRLSQLVVMHDGKLYSNAGKSTGRLLVTGEKARLGMLRKAHTRGELHYGRAAVLKHLSEMNVFWKGISLDLDAFIHGCPECLVHNPLRNKDVVTIPSKSSQLSPQERESADVHLAEDEEEESSYDDLIQFLTDGTFPSASTPQQQRRIRQRSESFCMIDGSLHYSGDSGDPKTPGSTGHPRQVLFTESWRNSAIKEAHIEDGMHLSPEDTQAKVRRRYFWSGMTFDILNHVVNCCTNISVCVPHRNPIIQQRVDKFHGYLRRENISTLNINTIRGFESDAGVPDSQEEAGQLEGQKDGEKHTVDMAQSDSPGVYKTSEHQDIVNSSLTKIRKAVDTDIVKTVEKIIEDVGKSLSGENKVLGAKESVAQRLDSKGKLSSGSHGSRKDAHKCPHCGKFISGNVAYRIHMYKHTGVKPFSCATCGKTFTTGKSLQVHTRKHTGIKPYLCNQCGREFFRGTSFKYHLKTHSRTKQQPLPCDQCSREFMTQNRLDKHKECKHPAEPKVYVCKHCGKVFTTARSLKWHEQSHSKPRKYMCLVCGKDFSRKEYLDSHHKTAHLSPETDPSKAHDSEPPTEMTVTTLLPQSQMIEAQQLLPHILHHAEQGTQLLHPADQGSQLLQAVDIPTSGSISVIHWNEEEHPQAVNHISISEQAGGHITITEHTTGGMVDQIALAGGDPNGGGVVSTSDIGDGHHISIGQQDVVSQSFAQPSDTGHTHTVHILTQAQLPMQHAPLVQHHHHQQQQHHHQQHHSHSHLLPAPLPSSSASSSVVTQSQLQSLQHSLQQGAAELLLQQDAVPVQYEVECPAGMTEADLNAVHLLAQSSLANQNILH